MKKNDTTLSDIRASIAASNAAEPAPLPPVTGISDQIAQAVAEETQLRAELDDAERLLVSNATSSADRDALYRFIRRSTSKNCIGRSTRTRTTRTFNYRASRTTSA